VPVRAYRNEILWHRGLVLFALVKRHDVVRFGIETNSPGDDAGIPGREIELADLTDIGVSRLAPIRQLGVTSKQLSLFGFLSVFESRMDPESLRRSQ
jgi:hypothetical protein